MASRPGRDSITTGLATARLPGSGTVELGSCTDELIEEGSDELLRDGSDEFARKVSDRLVAGDGRDELVDAGRKGLLSGPRDWNVLASEGEVTEA